MNLNDNKSYPELLNDHIIKMKAVTLILPHQLFLVHPSVIKSRTVYLVEEFLFFRQFIFHQQKLIFHRASMKYYENYLAEKNILVEYVECTAPAADVRILIPELAKGGITEIHYTDTTDNWLEKRIATSARETGIKLVRYPNPGFLNQLPEVEDFFSGKKSYFQTDFYTWQRKKRNVLLDAAKKPLGGKWTFDAENRLKFPKNEIVPEIDIPGENQYVKEAKEYIRSNFPDNYGSNESFIYPVTHTAAEKWLDDFLLHRFSKFGIYEDAMLKHQAFLYHSVLTPMLNTGLLLPQQVIDKAMQIAAEKEIPLNSLEGFIRQLMGWREFIRIVYEKEGSKQRSTNYWQFKRKIPASFWTGETGIHPVDTVIKRVLQTGYSHHIERLMVMGNFMLLCEFNPNDVYKWFMEMYIDSYDWVMVPNVYGMTQFADGGLMTTKPYISGSNYLLKMGDWDKGHWQEIWDGLFWRFMHVHRGFFLQNPRLGMLVGTFDKMKEEKRNRHLETAERFLQQLDNAVKNETTKKD